MENMTDQITNDLICKITKQQDDILKQMLTEKGFGHRIKRMGHWRFPGITVIHNNETKYIYADNGTPNGIFICGFSEPVWEPINETSQTTSITMTFNLITEEPLSLMIF